MSKAELVKELRARTGAGMSDCIKALSESNDDIELAIEWLRKNGAIKAAKKAGAVASEGIVKAFANPEASKVVLIEVNCQTDFVSKNEQFVALVNKIGNYILANIDDEAEVETIKIDGKLLAELGDDLTAVIGEKISFRRARILKANSNQSIGYYTHMNERIASAILAEGHTADKTILKNVAMHIAAMSPKYLSMEEVDQEWLAKESEIVKEQIREEIEKISDEKAKENKLAHIDQAIKGRVNKNIQEVSLINQKFIINQNETVGQYLSANKLKPLIFVNLVLGEGIEKKTADFAAEVAEQMGK